MRLTFFGPPGSGKGTQAQLVSDHFDLEHISTGILLREEIESGSELGRLIKETVESGHLVSDEIVNGEVFQRVRELDRFLLDGYPRNIAQAEELDAYLKGIDKPLSGSVFIHIPDEEVARRLSGRLVCGCPEGSRKTQGYSEGDRCPRCGEPFVRRVDDSSEVLDNRLSHYHSFTRHLEEYYTDRLLVIDGVGTIEEVFRRIRGKLEDWE
ncbi:MAG: adenylate kinase [Candidatus Aegiribacteria sp.]|nr:adenylate kinase [Candidatus Aegiribacteria sp.]MBD3294605.1 adenylate kinase [Candidatus Fermentibacteria bacterium]